MNTQKWRTLSRVFLMLLVTVHVVTWYTLGVHAVGSIGIEALFSGLSRGMLNAGFMKSQENPAPWGGVRPQGVQGGGSHPRPTVG